MRQLVPFALIAFMSLNIQPASAADTSVYFDIVRSCTDTRRVGDSVITFSAEAARCAELAGRMGASTREGARARCFLADLRLHGPFDEVLTYNDAARHYRDVIDNYVGTTNAEKLRIRAHLGLIELIFIGGIGESFLTYKAAAKFCKNLEKNKHASMLDTSRANLYLAELRRLNLVGSWTIRLAKAISLLKETISEEETLGVYGGYAIWARLALADLRRSGQIAFTFRDDPEHMYREVMRDYDEGTRWGNWARLALAEMRVADEIGDVMTHTEALRIIQMVMDGDPERGLFFGARAQRIWDALPPPPYEAVAPQVNATVVAAPALAIGLLAVQPGAAAK